MPEIGEVARVVHFLRKHLVGRTIRECQAFNDDIVYGKVGCSSSAFQQHVEGRKVTGAAQQGKYFYVTFDKAPHAVMHLGMTGWVEFDSESTYYYKQAKETPAKAQDWPPKYAKFLLKCDAEMDGDKRDKVEVAFVDARRLARIRLVDCHAESIRDQTPLKENGPDPVRDRDEVTVKWLSKLLKRKKVPVKALLLDQGNISGVGNWVADEVLFQARIHPEQYSNTFDEEEIERLHHALTDVTSIAVSTLGDSTKFPENWIMKYRWDKGKKNANVLPNGEKIVHLKVGGRTSAIVPSVQKKTAAVAGDVDSADLSDKEQKQPVKGKKRKTFKDEDEPDMLEVETPAKKGKRRDPKSESMRLKKEAEEKPATPISRRSSRRVSK
ncbi:Hypothetical protein R9X50_00247600 [Acrodontium crateriforme]|uniref:Formamidopyrimidine-DNA glycosylase catalytic domain-containing protein n=1 Tax=Acrodontium crateriforme TaxID=150365 RepID=A0AAQ3M1L1_9PEZI|nr:Hypothetical protein R9X50_00247600 [Acrodontium crateriforme]